jgi:hypothetical protein
VFVLAAAVLYRQWPQPHSSHYVLALALVCNSAVNLVTHAQDPAASFLYYHVSFVLVVAALLGLVYTV